MHRDRRYPGGLSPAETIQAHVDRACDPYRPEPDLGLCLEVAEYIQAKKANTARDAAMATVRLINNRNQHVAMLALFLLDILVKNCGYPFHLQIATKEFLNELVRRFPERPPGLAPPPMTKILELIHEWKNTLCTTSKHKEDLVHIRDMHRLLSYKGYRFPDFDRRSAAVLNPADTLKSPDELEEEDREAQAAKLQELIRRGTPKDLAAAQQLMKIMSGAEPDKQPDYASQTQKELTAVNQRVIMLNDMLNNAKPNERFAEGDAFDQIAKRCRMAQPKIQKWVSETAEDDPKQMENLLQMNDLINQVLDRYEAFKRGDRSSIAEIDTSLLKASTSSAKAASANSRNATKAAPALPNLIDFDDLAAASSSSPASSNKQSQQDDLASLASLSIGNSNGTSSSNGLPNDLFSGSASTLPATRSTNAWSNLQSGTTVNWSAFSQPTNAGTLLGSTSSSSAWSSMGQAGNSGGIQLPSGRPTMPNNAGPSFSSTSFSNARPQTPNYQQPSTTSNTSAQSKKPDPFADLLS